MTIVTDSCHCIQWIQSIIHHMACPLHNIEFLFKWFGLLALFCRTESYRTSHDLCHYISFLFNTIDLYILYSRHPFLKYEFLFKSTENSVDFFLPKEMVNILLTNIKNIESCLLIYGRPFFFYKWIFVSKFSLTMKKDKRWKWYVCTCFNSHSLAPNKQNSFQDEFLLKSPTNHIDENQFVIFQAQ